VLQKISELFDGFSLSPQSIYQVFQPFRKMLKFREEKGFDDYSFIVANNTPFEQLSSHDALTALTDGTNCLSHLVQIIKERMFIHRNKILHYSI
jgi:hypothetical protein